MLFVGTPRNATNWTQLETMWNYVCIYTEYIYIYMDLDINILCISNIHTLYGTDIAPDFQIRCFEKFPHLSKARIVGLGVGGLDVRVVIVLLPCIVLSVLKPSFHLRQIDTLPQTNGHFCWPIACSKGWFSSETSVLCTKIYWFMFHKKVEKVLTYCSTSTFLKKNTICPIDQLNPTSMIDVKRSLIQQLVRSPPKV